jgi:hypothetical protein
MTTRFSRAAMAALACTAVFAFAAPAQADMMRMTADLTASNEVPPNNSKASGSVDVIYDTASKKVSWNGSYENLSGPATAAHFHTGEAGKNGGVAVPIFSGANAKSPFSGSATLTDAQARDLMAGKWYVNIHTAAHKAGEIRGQVKK